MNTANPSKIIVTTDFSENAASAFPYALALARRHGADLLVLHVVTGHSDYPLDNKILVSCEETIRADARARLARLDLGPTEGLKVRREVVSAWSAADGIISIAETEGSDLIIMSTHGHRLLALLFLGSVARKVVGAAPCPVLCLKRDRSGIPNRGAKEIRFERALVPIDLSEHSRRSLRLAAQWVRSDDAQLHLMYVVHLDIPPNLLAEHPSEAIGLDEALHSRVSRRLAVFEGEIDPGIDKVVTTIDSGPPTKRIARYAKDHEIDLIVLSRKGLGNTPHPLTLRQYTLYSSPNTLPM